MQKQLIPNHRQANQKVQQPRHGGAGQDSH